MLHGKPPTPGYQLGLDSAPPPPGYALALALAESAARPGYALGLEFVAGDAPPRPPASTLRPGGALPAPAPSFTGQLLASAQDNNASLRPSGNLPFAAPAFAGQQTARYAEHHLATPSGGLPLASPGIAGQLTAPYNSNVQRPLARMAHRLQFEQAQPASAALANVFEDARAAAAQVRALVQQAQGVASSTQVREQVARITGQPVQSCAQQAQPLRHGSAAQFQSAQRLHPAPVQDSAQQAQALLNWAVAQHWQIASPHRGAVQSLYQDAGVVRHMGLRNPLPVPTPMDGASLPGWGIALEFAPQFIVPRTWGELHTRQPELRTCNELGRPLQHRPQRVCYQSNMRPPPAPAFAPWPPGSGPAPDPDPPGPGQTIVITTRRAYIVQNHITLTRLDTGAELQAHSFGMSLDYQSWTWSWQASLHHSAAPHLGRDAQGEPAELLASVNGVDFRLRLERVARERRHLPQERFSVSGKGRAAILDAPWAPTMQFGNADNDYTAEQLAAQVLTINNVPIGWDVDWQLDDWLVPQGAWAHQGSYISAVNEIAQAAGGYVQPHPTDKVLRILHRYPSAPWDWGSVTPDFEIPAALAEVESTEYLDKPAYNRVYVGGVGTGVFGPMTRTGTGGDLLAPQATHPLITASAAWQQRARAELSDTGRQERLRLSLPVLPETGVIVPGQFVRYLATPSTPTVGIVRGTAIDWQFPRLRQTLELETHEFI